MGWGGQCVELPFTPLSLQVRKSQVSPSSGEARIMLMINMCASPEEVASACVMWWVGRSNDLSFLTVPQRSYLVHHAHMMLRGASDLELTGVLIWHSTDVVVQFFVASQHKERLPDRLQLSASHLPFISQSLQTRSRGAAAHM